MHLTRERFVFAVEGFERTGRARFQRIGRVVVVKSRGQIGPKPVIPPQLLGFRNFPSCSYSALTWLQVHSVRSYMRQVGILWRVHEAKCAQSRFIFSSPSKMTTTTAISTSISMTPVVGCGCTPMWINFIDGHEVSRRQPSKVARSLMMLF